MQAPDVADSRIGRSVAVAFLWLAGPLFIRRNWDPSDMIATIKAEDAFDLRGRLCEISAPTLDIGGGRDRFYPTGLFRETADGIPNARLVLYENKAHGGTLADLLQQAVTLSGVNRGEIYLASPPVPVQKVLLAVLAPQGRVLGYKDHYPKYSGAEDPGSRQAGPPSTTRVLAGRVAAAASLLAASLFLIGRVRRLSKG